MIDVKVAGFLKCLNATIPLASTLGNEYPSSNETSKKNGTVRGDCIACDALFSVVSVLVNELYSYPVGIWCQNDVIRRFDVNTTSFYVM